MMDDLHRAIVELQEEVEDLSRSVRQGIAGLAILWGVIVAGIAILLALR